MRGLIKTYANAAFERQGKDIPKYIWHLHFEEFAAAIRAISSPDIADAGKVEGDGSAAARDVLAERRRQIEAEGWTPEHDDQWRHGALAKAATCYASVHPVAASYWPWDLKWWKPSDRRRNLVKAAALILAEIERLDRKASEGGSNV
ncbi:hypothetical protein F9K96_06890 [Brucella anthropi]|uniref:hypothetical protein n=1 Tax=Brucella anthropi TaxID=529 RepID=UPI00124E0623|nr:hypothetical protein [Brucella anthropi]KAB2792847.1 hypothetical protein F9K96_06890 [Brucella anthropi]